jgi:hypothetical protein
MRLLSCLFVLVTGAGARADEPPTQVLATAVRALEYGDVEAAVTALRPIAENGAVALPAKQDRIEALRAYGIASALSQRRVAAEGAFLLLLQEQPDIRFDPRLVRPEAVTLLESVRQRFPPLPPRSPARPWSRQMKAGVSLLALGAGCVGAGSVTNIDASLSFGAQSREWATVAPLTLYAGALVFATVGVVLLARGLRAHRH